MENSTETTAAAEKLPDPAAPKFAGLSTELDGKTYIVPALNLRQVIELQPKMDSLAGFTENTLAGEYFDTVLEIILPAIQRNYPSVTRDDLEGMVDLNNVGELVRAATGQVKEGLVQPAAPSRAPVGGAK